MPFGLQFITLSSSKHCLFICRSCLAACSNLLLAKYNLLAMFVWVKWGVNIPINVTDQSTNQTWPSEIPRSTSYCVSISPDPPLPFFSSFFAGAGGASGNETKGVVVTASLCCLYWSLLKVPTL